MKRILNWIYRYRTDGLAYDPFVYVCAIIQTTLYVDFFYYYLTKYVLFRFHKLQHVLIIFFDFFLWHLFNPVVGVDNKLYYQLKIVCFTVGIDGPICKLYLLYWNWKIVILRFALLYK